MRISEEEKHSLKLFNFQEPKKGGFIYIMEHNWELLLLTIPALVYFAMFNYAPMFGLVLSFKNYKYNLGIFGSQWNGLKNFEYFFKSVDFARIMRNTTLYSSEFIIVGVTINVAVALLLYEISNRAALKIYQTIITIPRFLSWVIVGFITYALLNPTMGVINQILILFGKGAVNWYTIRGPWPIILTFTYVWKNVGMGCIMYYAALMGIDPTLYEAAKIDGASRWKQTWHISIPSLIPIMTIMTILAIGNIFRGDFGLFYQIPRDVGILYPVTDIIDTYVFRGLRNGDIGVNSAVGLIQSFFGLVLVLVTNTIIRKIDPESSLF